MLSRVVECMSHESKDNIQVFVICPLCMMLCSYGETHTNLELLKQRVCSESCLCVYFSMEETLALNEFFHRFWNLLFIYVWTIHMHMDNIQILYG